MHEVPVNIIMTYKVSIEAHGRKSNNRIIISPVILILQSIW
jgi:hypothetical protein